MDAKPGSTTPAIDTVASGDTSATANTTAQAAILNSKIAVPLSAFLRERRPESLRRLITLRKWRLAWPISLPYANRAFHPLIVYGGDSPCWCNDALIMGTGFTVR